jgi:hypothetical protein
VERGTGWGGPPIDPVDDIIRSHQILGAGSALEHPELPALVRAILGEEFCRWTLPEALCST